MHYSEDVGMEGVAIALNMHEVNVKTQTGFISLQIGTMAAHCKDDGSFQTYEERKCLAQVNKYCFLEISSLSVYYEIGYAMYSNVS